MSVQLLYTLTLIFFGAGALGAVLLYKTGRYAHYWAHGFVMLASVTGLLAGAMVLKNGVPIQFNLLPLKGITIPFIVSIDAFSAVFMMLIGVLTFCASWYGLAYMKHYEGRYSLARFGVWYAIFAASLVGVVSTQSIFTFLWWWELMSISSYFLVTYDYRDEANVRAGTMYLVMTQIGTACIAAALVLMALATGALDFASIGSVSGSLTGWFPHVVFALFLVGFGIKAGIIPLHVWLPEAHPAAPSHVSALMSGVMIKLAIYMLIRVLFEIMPFFHLWWGMIIVILGALSALLGVLYALTEHDMKRLLAYHSVENIGIILLGVGSAIMLKSMGFDALALLALVAGVFHTINHALFKSLLFLGAGAVFFKTHTRDIEKYGGLIKLMPWTAGLFLVGAVAISGLPPFNGFASEWLTFQTMFAGVALGLGMKVQSLWIGATVALALTSGLAAACFVKAFGVSFLGRARTQVASSATEVSFTMIGPMIVLAVLCLMFGIFASTSVIPYLSAVLQNFVLDTAVSSWPTLASMPTPWTFELSNLWAFGILVVLGLLVVGFIRVWGGKRKVTRDIPWDCGVDITPRMEISASAFSRSLITMFKGILRPSKQTEIEYHDNAMRYFVSSHTVSLHLHDLYAVYLYRPISRFVLWCSGRTKRMQSGILNAYILYIAVALIILLIIALR